MAHMTEQQRQEAVVFYQAGVRVKWLAARYKVDRCTIQRLIKRRGIPRRRRGGAYDGITRTQSVVDSLS